MARRPDSATSTFAAPVVKKDPKESMLQGGWEKRIEDDGTEQWINRRDFIIRGGAVPQGTIRPLEEAIALEVQRLG